MNKKIGAGVFLILIGLSLMIFFSSKYSVLLSPVSQQEITSGFNLNLVLTLILFVVGIILFVNGNLEEKVSKEESTGLIVVAGYKEPKRDYADFLARLRKLYPTQIIALKGRGKSTGEKMIAQFIKSDEIARRNLGTDKIIYVGHSMGFPLMVEAAKRHNRRVDGYIGMATYPSAGDCLNSNENPDERNILQRIADYIPNISTLSFPTRKSKIKKAKFIVAEGDHVCYKWRPESTMKRFVKYFSGVPDSEVVVIPGNHSFNDAGIERPFNVSHPDVLIDEIRKYVEKI